MLSKKSSRDKHMKLTDFFTQRSSASVPALAAPSDSMGSAASKMSPVTRKRPAAQTREDTMDPESPIMTSAHPEERSSSRIVSRKRARSPDNVHPSPSLLPSPVKLKSARKTVGSEHPRAVVYITPHSSSRNSLAQGQTSTRMHTSVASPSDSSYEVVYSSQSDEEELALPNSKPRGLGSVVESVHTWRRRTLGSPDPSLPYACEDFMVVDPFNTHDSPFAHAVNSSAPDDALICSVAASGSSTALQTPIVTSLSLPSSPDTNELPPLPPTPVPINSDTKTAKLIAAIKARIAANQPGDDDRHLSYRELEDSDDDDLVDELPLIRNARGRSPVPRTGNDLFSSPLSSVPSTFNGATIDQRTPDPGSPLPPPARVSARKRAPAPRLPVRISDSVTKTLSSNPKKSKAMNPLQALLREKQLQDKRGTGFAALRLAEEAIRQDSCEASIGSSSELIDQPRLSDEQAAWKAVYDSRRSASANSLSDVEDYPIGDRASKILGTAAGEAVNKILSGDQDSKGKAKARNVDQMATPGVSLWIRHSDEDMDIDSTSTVHLTGHPILDRLDDALRNGNDSLLDLILRAGMLGTVPSEILLSNIPQLLDITLFATSQVSDAICIALRSLWAMGQPRLKIPATAVLSALVWLGADPSVLEGLGLITERAQKNHISYETFHRALKRLLAILKTAGLSGAFDSHDIGNVVLSLVVVGLDSSTPNELHSQLIATLNVICNCCTTDCLPYDTVEKILNFAKQLAPISKSQLVSFFASGSDCTRRIAQHLAYYLLVSVPIAVSHDPPPLEPLVLSVSPDVGFCKPFDVTNESTDYEELRHYVNILSVALIDITPYVEEERSTAKSRSNNFIQGSPGKPKKPLVPLELLRSVLEVLQGKIVDTRAAHLDRSRTKAEIQRLAMRINYERMALISTRVRRQRASTLKAYFSPQRP